MNEPTEAQPIVLPILQCKRCGHAWIPRVTTLPVRCPRCKHLRWREEAPAPKTEASA